MSLMAIGAAAWQPLGAGPDPGEELLPVSFSQSSKYGTGDVLLATPPKMRDGNHTTGAATLNSGSEWIRADLGEAKQVAKVQIGGGNLTSWGPVAAYINGRTIQYSTDDVNWTNVATAAGASDAPPYFADVPFSAVTARYFRILSIGYMATTEFRLFAP